MTHDHHTHHSCNAGHDHAGESSAEGRDPTTDIDAPVLVEVTRGGMVESVHRGRAAVVDAHGHVVARWGDIGAAIYPRSAIKPLQAIPLVESGALDAYKLSDAELALACSSHWGEPRHTRMTAAWLDRIGCSADDLECGPQVPFDDDTANEMIRQNEGPTALHNNCSGKHAGFLTTARHRNEPIRGYTRFDHPVQQRVLGVLEQMTGQDLSSVPWGIDGCGIPTIAIPLDALAFAMARIAEPAELPERRAEAVARIRVAWAAHPYLIGGRNSFDTEIMRLTNGHVLVKSGAEGVAAVVLPRAGLGIALKIDDGSSRARDVAVAAILRSLHGVSQDLPARAAHLITQPIHNRSGREVGLIRPAYGSFPGDED